MNTKMFLLLLVVVGQSFATEVKNCNVGADPWYPKRPALESDKVWVLEDSYLVESLSKSGKPSSLCRLLPGEEIRLPAGFDPAVAHPYETREQKMKLAWIRRCGNPIIRLYREKKEPKTAPIVVPPKKPLFEGVNTDFNRVKTIPREYAEPPKTQVQVVVIPPPTNCYNGYYGCWTGTGIPGNTYWRSTYVSNGPYGADTQRIVGGQTYHPHHHHSHGSAPTGNTGGGPRGSSPSGNTSGHSPGGGSGR